MLLVAPGCLYIFSGEKVNRNSPRRSQLLSNCFQQFCNTDQASSDQAPAPGFGINPWDILPGLPSSRGSAASPRSTGKERIRPGSTGLRFTSAKLSSVLRNTTEGLMRCCPNLSMISADLHGLKETVVKIMKGLTLPFQAAGIKQSNCLCSF